MITSSQNPKIKWVRSLQAQRRTRQKEAAFVVEGVRLVEEALASGWPARLVLYTPDLPPRGQAAVDAYASQGTAIVAVQENVMRSASDTETPQGVLAVLTHKELLVPSPLDLVLVVDGVRDPGNLGTLLRSASAAGAQLVLLPPGSTDPYAPKVMRAGMGAHFRIPVITCTWQQIESHLGGLEIYLAAAEGGLTYYQTNFKIPMALIIGSEAEGVSENAQELATTSVNIPMPGGGESLNAAIAASVLLFEVVRQRAQSGTQNEM
jgi:TrmH family RNA methyltransferase